MNRRQFIRYGSTISLGAAVLPTLSFGSSAEHLLNGSFSLPSANEHVRHGLYQLKPLKHLLLPKWVKFYERNCFYRNGFDHSKGKFEVFTLELDQKLINLGWDDEHLIVSYGDATMKYERVQSDFTPFEIGDRKIQFLEADATVIEDGNINDAIVVCLKGKVSVDGESLIENEIQRVKQLNKLVVKDKSLALIIQG